ncbi:MAG: 1,4-alpha-glucan branching protein domain-containing protein [Planctomycetota bacterium]
MSDPLGSFCLVLHGHLPYVLRHGTWPHGEDWLYEAAAETYLPILAMVDECLFFNATPRLTMGLTPVLLEQLSHEHFKKGFVHYLEDRIAKAKEDRATFASPNFDNGHMIYLAEQWEAFFTKALEQFEGYGRDIPKAYAERAGKGYFEILTSNATHGYMPLLLEDSCIRAQVRAGVASSERILGFKPTGMWLPECAYRGGGTWTPPINWGVREGRIGIEHLVADEGITHFFTENHLIEGSRSEQVFNDGQWWKVDWSEAEKYPSRGWRSVNEPHGVNSDGTGLARAAAFGRDQHVCEKVWSGSIGYPADGVYLEFHKQFGPRRGLRYWKITGKGTDLGDKHLYYPENVPGKLHEHAQDFVNSVKDRLRAYRDAVGRPGVVVTTFDAELFGHWWFEGPQFLRDVMLTMHADPEINLTTTKDYLDETFVDKVASLPEGSWGDGGDHRVWTNDEVNWMWDIEYRCEATFGRLTNELKWRDGANDQVKSLLEKAGRELLLLQASDWPFVIRRGQAVDYGIKRFMQHVARFESLCDIAEKVDSDSAYLGQLNEVEKHEIADADIHDVIFPVIDLNWWSM